jgi:putative phosphoesterase
VIKALIFSDSHKQFEPMRLAIENEVGVNWIIHAGDMNDDVEDLMALYPKIPVASVKGNNDFAYYSEIPYHMTLNIKGHKILVTHGHMILRSYFNHEPLAERAKAEGADIVFFGHTHMPCDETIDGIRLLNPGSVTQNRDGSPPSYMLVHISPEEVTAEKKEFIQSFGRKGGLLDRLMKFLMGEKEEEI